MSHWIDHHFEERIRLILREIYYHNENHPLGRPFLSSYQIAIEFDNLYPEVRGIMGLQLGGKDIGEHVSFSQYIARELSRNIVNRIIADIEGGFISNLHLAKISFYNNINNSELITSSLTTI